MPFKKTITPQHIDRQQRHDESTIAIGLRRPPLHGAVFHKMARKMGFTARWKGPICELQSFLKNRLDRKLGGGVVFRAGK
jgi:hypothetical protein